MMRNYSTLGPGSSQPTGSMNVPQQVPQAVPSFPPTEPPINLASKVAEVFLTAGHAFQKLGDLTLQLHSTVEPDECKWTERDVDQLRDSLTRFAHELDMISQSVQGRTTKHIKTDIKRRHMIQEDPRRPVSPGMKRQIPMTSGMPTKRMNIVQAPKAVPIRTVVPLAPPSRIPLSTHPLTSQTHISDQPSQYSTSTNNNNNNQFQA